LVALGHSLGSVLAIRSSRLSARICRHTFEKRWNAIMVTMEGRRPTLKTKEEEKYPVPSPNVGKRRPERVRAGKIFDR
jgi:hypothetical protein